MLKPLIISLVLLCAALLAAAQPDTAISLEKCQEMARTNYPLVKKHDLIARSREYSIANASTGYLPQFSISGQATYQSAVTELPLEAPGFEVPRLQKDQYKIYGEINQKLFDGGAIKQQKNALAAGSAVEEQALEVALYQLKERVNQLFFGILTVDEQWRQNGLLQNDIEQGLHKIRAAIQQGAALKSEGDVLQAEWLKTQQRSTELKAARQAYADMLGIFIGQPLDEQTRLKKPDLITIMPDIRRPELALYDQQLQSLDIQEKTIETRNLPRLDLFFQGGAGQPALNFLKPGMEPYYITGLRLSWNFSGFYTSKNEKALIQVSRHQLGLEKEVFLFNTGLSVRQEHADIARFQELLSSDDEIIALRSQVKKTSLAKLENGVINTSDYLREVNAEDQARLNKILHEIQLLAALYSNKTTTGN